MTNEHNLYSQKRWCQNFEKVETIYITLIQAQVEKVEYLPDYTEHAVMSLSLVAHIIRML